MARRIYEIVLYKEEKKPEQLIQNREVSEDEAKKVNKELLNDGTVKETIEEKDKDETWKRRMGIQWEFKEWISPGTIFGPQDV